MSKILVAALFGVCSFAFVAAPIGIDLTSGKVTMQSAFAKHGADDVLPDDRGQDAVPHP
jgi:hypothetical protein